MKAACGAMPKMKMAAMPMKMADGGQVSPWSIRGIYNKLSGPAETVSQKYARQDAEYKAAHPDPAAAAPTPAKPTSAITNYAGDMAVKQRVDDAERKALGMKDGGQIKRGAIRAMRMIDGGQDPLAGQYGHAAIGAPVDQGAAMDRKMLAMSAAERAGQTAPTMPAPMMTPQLAPSAQAALTGMNTLALTSENSENPEETNPLLQTLYAKKGGQLQTGKGGAVPGKGKGDKIKALYEPKEFVVSNDMMKMEPGLQEHLHALRVKTLAGKGMTPAMADAGRFKKGAIRAMSGLDPLEAFFNTLPLAEHAAAREAIAAMGDAPATSSTPAVTQAPVAPVTTTARSVIPTTPNIQPTVNPMGVAPPPVGAAPNATGAIPRPTSFPGTAPLPGVAPVAPSVPAAPGQLAQKFGTAQQWGEFGNKFSGAGNKIAGAAKGAVRIAGKVAPLVAIPAGAYEAYQGVQNGDNWQTAKGAGDAVAGAALLTPAAPAAGLYLGGRALYEGGKYAAGKIADLAMSSQHAKVAEMLKGNAGAASTTPRAPRIPGAGDATMPGQDPARPAATALATPDTANTVNGVTGKDVGYGATRYDVPGKSPLFTNLTGPEGQRSNEALMNRGAISPQNMGAADAMQQRTTNEAQGQINKAQYDQEVAAANATNAWQAQQTLERKALGTPSFMGSNAIRPSKAAQALLAEQMTQQTANQSDQTTRRGQDISGKERGAISKLAQERLSLDQNRLGMDQADHSQKLATAKQAAAVQAEYLAAGDDPVKIKAVMQKMRALGMLKEQPTTYHPGQRTKNVDGSETITDATTFNPNTGEVKPAGQTQQQALPPGLVVGASTKQPDGVYPAMGKTVTIKGGKVTEIK